MGTRTRVEVDLALLGISWQKNTAYRIALEAGFVAEDGGEYLTSPANTSNFTFTSNVSGPVISSTIPAVNYANIENYATITLIFDRKIIKNSGFIKFYKYATNELVTSLNINEEANVRLSDDGYRILFDTIDSLQEANTTYYFTIDANAFKDYDNFYNDAVTNHDTLKFTTGNAPILVSSTPADNATNVATNSIILTFDKTMKKGSGNIDIYDSATDELIYRVPVGDSRVTVANTIVTIDTTFIFNSDTIYYVKIGSVAFRSASGLAYAGISNKTTLNFTTRTGATVSGLYDWPIYGAAYNGAIIYFDASVDILPTPENAVGGTKGVKLWQVGNGIAIRTFYDGDGYTDTSAQGIVINCASFLDYGNEYYFTIDEGAYYNGATNLRTPGVTTKTASLTFNTSGVMVDDNILEYVGNSSNYPWLGDNVSIEQRTPKLLSSTASYSLIFTSNIGQFGLSYGSPDFAPNGNPVSTLTFTGTRTQINDALGNGKIVFYPTKNATTNGTYSITLKQGTTTIDSITKAMNYSGTTTGSETITFSTNGTFTPTLEQLTYRNTADVLLVGAGGSAYPAGSGGGGGGVLEISNYSITNISYTITVASSPLLIANNYVATAPNGTDTTAFGQTAYGGKGASGTAYLDPSNYVHEDGVGGNSGAPTIHTGGTYNNFPSYPGSGAGAGANGATGSYNPAAVGGIGIDSTIFGTFGGDKLGAGGSAVGISAITFQYPRDAGHGGCGYNTGTPETGRGAKGIVMIKLKS